MRTGLGVLGTLVIVIGAAYCSSAQQEPEFTSLFDGRSLSGWTLESTDRFSVKDGVIVNDGGTGWLRSNKSYRDFEFRAEYRVLMKGSDSGIMFRATAESMPREPHWPERCYQLQVIDGEGNCMLFGHGLAPPRFRTASGCAQDGDERRQSMAETSTQSRRIARRDCTQ